MPRFAVQEVGEWIVAGTGYTGEDGVEIHVPAADAPALWDAIVAAGITPAGLGARDTLRLEAALPLHGHELGAGITSLQAGLGWVVRWDKGDFRGRAPLEAERERGSRADCSGISIEGRRPARDGATVLLDGADGGRGDQRQLLADARSRDRARVPAPRHRTRARRYSSTCAASCSRARS